MIGITADLVFGQCIDEEMTRLIADINIKALHIRSLATPLHDYVAFVAFAEKIILAVLSLLPVFRPLGVSSWINSFNNAAIYSEARQEEVGYCRFLLQQLH